MSESHEERIFIGDLLRAKGYATAEQILDCLNLQRREDEEGRTHRRLGEILLDRGYLTRAQLDEALVLIGRGNAPAQATRADLER